MFDEFNLSVLDFDKQINQEELQTKIFNLVCEIMKDEFAASPQKQIVRNRNGRINFCCPYCGDSYKDHTKRRGNLYIDDYGYHCYNCQKHTSLNQFLTDFNKSLSGNELVFVKNLHSQNIERIKQHNIVDNSFFFSDELLDKYAIDKSIIFETYKLKSVKNVNWARNYLTNRHQFNFDLFGWDDTRMRLFIFNLTKSGKILGFQVRNFKTEPKYVTHTLKMIYETLKIDIKDIEEFDEVNKLSFLFGLNTINLSKPVIKTEGPLDSFLLQNALSYCGADNDLPLDIPEIRYLFDFDKTGTTHAIEKLKSGEYVFLWKQYLKDIGYEIIPNKKIDMTDIITWAYKNSVELPNVLKYFGNTTYDIYNI